MKIAYVLYPDFTALDLVGPYEIISRWPDAEVHFVARSLDPVRCDRGLTVIPTDTPETLADPDLIVVPGSQNPVSLTKRVHGRELAESLQLLIEYDPEPAFASGAATKADASTLRLAFRLLLGDRPLRMVTRVNGQAATARLRRAQRAWRERRARAGGAAAPAAR